MRSPPLDVEDEPEIIGVHPGTVSPAVVSSDPLRKLFIWSTGHFVTPPIPDEIQEAQTHQIILDARWIHNPAYGALGRYHSGRHPGIFNGIYAVPGVLTWAVEALVEARQFSSVDIKVMCSAGRHRSVAIAELLKAVAAQTLHAEVEILFLRWAKVQGGWGHLCAPCAVCAGFQAHEDFKYYVQEAVAEYQRLTAAAYKDPFVLDMDCRGQLEWNPPSLLICSGDVAAMPSQGTQQWFEMQGKVKSFTHIFCFGRIISCCFLIMGLLQMRCNCTQPIFTANNNKVFNQQIFRSRRKSNPINFTLLHLSQCTGKERWSSCSDQHGYEDHTMTTTSIAATQVRNYHDKARGKTARDSLRQHAQGARFRGGAVPWVGLLICSRRACVDICAAMDRHPFMQPCWQSVGLHASAGRNTSCSFGLNSSQATNCISTGKLLDFDFWQFENNQMEWKGTAANHFDWQISDLSKHNILHTSNVCFCDWLMHKFCQHIHNNFRTFPHISDWMALADQVRRVAQAENYALPRAWRGRSGNVGNLVPRILERPTAKARLNSPVPSRSPDLDLARAVVQQVEEAPTPTEAVEIVELLEDDPGTQEQQVHLVSVGARWNDNQAIQDFGRMVECDLRLVEDPGRDRSLQSHLGFHPDTVSRMIANMEFLQPFFDAFFEALQHPQSTIRFTCASGRHRSVVAVHLAQAVLRGIVSQSNMSIQHASRSHWAGLCNQQCAECYNFVHYPPAPYMRAVADIREDLLQALRGYMHRGSACMLFVPDVRYQALQTCSQCQTSAACAGTMSNISTTPSTCAMEKINRFEFKCAAISALLQSSAQQISVLQPSKCTTKGWQVFLHSPFLNPGKSRNWFSDAIEAVFRGPHPYPSLGSGIACPLRKSALERSSYWDKVFARFFTWPLLHSQSCYSAERSTFPLVDGLGFFPTQRFPLAPTTDCHCLMQPRKAQVGVDDADPDGHVCGNYGIHPGRTKGIAFLYGSGEVMRSACSQVHLQQICEICMSDIGIVTNAFVSSKVNALCQPVVLNTSLTIAYSNLNPILIKEIRIRNGLGSYMLLCTRPFQDFTHQQIQIMCRFGHNTVTLSRCNNYVVSKHEFQQHSISVGILCLGIRIAMSTERLSEALQRVAKAKVSPSLPNAFAAPPGGPVAPKLIGVPAPTVSPKPSAVPPALPRALNLEEDETQQDDVYQVDPAVETDLSAATDPTPAASPKPSAAPPMPPRAINLEEDEAPESDTVDACLPLPGARGVV